MMPEEPTTTRSHLLGCLCGFLPLALGICGVGVAIRNIPGDYAGANAAMQGFWFLLGALLTYYLEALFMSICYESRHPKVSAFSHSLFLGLFLSYLVGLMVLMPIVLESDSSYFVSILVGVLILGALGLIWPILVYVRDLMPSKGTRR